MKTRFSQSSLLPGRLVAAAAGVGPVISFATKSGKADLAAELKWLSEVNVEKRLKGDTIWFKPAGVF